MSCPGIPLNTTVPTPCGHYLCNNDNTGSTCVLSQYVFAPHWIKQGTVLRGASGGYVPAITVCQLGIVTVKIGRVASHPGYPYYGL